MKAVSVVLLAFLALSASAIRCGVNEVECADDGTILTDEDTFPYDSINSSLPFFPEPLVTFENETWGMLDAVEGDATALQAGAPIKITISAAEVTKWINSGGKNPIETGLIKKILEFLNSAGISIQGSSVVYEMKKGADIELKGGCSNVHLLSGWNAYATLKPGFKVSLTFGVNDLSLVVGSKVHADCDFGMGGKIQAKFGKKVFKKCIRLLRKTESVKIGAKMVMVVISRLELKPTLDIDAQLNVIIGLKPFYQIRGDLLKFEPTGKVTIRIFGIHIGFIEKKISSAIKDGIKKAFNQRTVNEQFAKVTAAVQKSLDNTLGQAKWVIPLLPSGMVPQMKAAVKNINDLQAKNM